MTLALQSPDSISAVISLDNAPVDAVLQSSFGTYIEAMKKIEAANVLKPADADAILKKYEPSLPIRQFLLTNLIRPKPESGTRSSKTPLKFRIPITTLAGALGEMGDFPFKRPEEARFLRKSLFVRGIESKYVPDDVLPIVGRFFPSFTVENVEAGHWVVSENLEAVRSGMCSP